MQNAYIYFVEGYGDKIVGIIYKPNNITFVIKIENLAVI